MDDIIDVLVSDDEFSVQDNNIQTDTHPLIPENVPETDVEEFTTTLARSLLTALSFLLSTLNQENLPDQHYLVRRIYDAVLKEVTDQLTKWDHDNLFLNTNSVSEGPPAQPNVRHRRPTVHRSGTILIPGGKPYQRRQPRQPNKNRK